MGWRTVVVSKSSKLDLKLGYMVVRDSEETVRIHISEISVLIIENTASSVTVSLLSELTKQKIKVIFCDEKRNPSSELVSYYGCHDTSLKVRSQMEWQSNLYQHCAEVEKQARDMFGTLIEQMKANEGVSEELKEENQMEWVCRMQNIEARAREVVAIGLIYK